MIVGRLYVLINALTGKARKIDRMSWVLVALFVLRIIMKALV